MANVLDLLQERGYIEQVSDQEALHAALDQPLSFYIGYDPSAVSLHVGHLLTIMVVANLQRAGHRPLILVGGGTGMIGDPSGRTEMRKLLAVEAIQTNVRAIQQQLSRFISFDEGKAIVVNNADWLLKLGYIDFLREIGQHFSVNRMIAMEAYRQRLERGLSFIEFNYQLLQAYDFLHLYRTYDCRLQLGGNDQWGNILAGVDLIRRVDGGEAFAMTTPLLTTSSGAKMGKSAEGALWLNGDMLSPYDFYQYWVNVEDDDVERFLRLYTFKPLEEVAELTSVRGSALNHAKQVLAYTVTSLVHGAEAAEQAQGAARALFGGSGERAAIPSTPLALDRLTDGLPLVDALVEVGLSRSKSEARRLVEQGGAYVNDQAVPSTDRLLGTDDIQEGEILLRAGKKRFHRLTVA
ncbi:MAG: tyrosine--tRNA ligase [Anaerolineae bacterium]|jgi:tyrosyl-tRNA synthetase|nr:tyrosine--tRNA ligase [Chloroflexota bacterium]